MREGLQSEIFSKCPTVLGSRSDGRRSLIGNFGFECDDGWYENTL